MGGSKGCPETRILLPLSYTRSLLNNVFSIPNDQIKLSIKCIQMILVLQLFNDPECKQILSLFHEIINYGVFKNCLGIVLTTLKYTIMNSKMSNLGKD